MCLEQAKGKTCILNAPYDGRVIMSRASAARVHASDELMERGVHGCYDGVGRVIEVNHSVIAVFHPSVATARLIHPGKHVVPT
jgi:hypothetical protein